MTSGEGNRLRKVDWIIGSFPEEWEVSRFGIEFSLSMERNGASPVGVPLSISEYRGVEVRDRKDGQQLSLDVSNYRVVRPGQLAVNSMWLDHGGLGVSRLTGYISPAYAAYNISRRLLPPFVHYLLRSQSYVQAFRAMGTGVRPNSQMVSAVDLGQIPIPIPPLETQRAIADYLDRETAEINSMLAELDDLVALLEERKQGLFTRTVSSMRDSEWRTTSLSTVGTIVLGKMLDERKNVGEPCSYIRAANVSTDGRISLDDIKTMRVQLDERDRLSLKKGDIVMIEGGDAGRVAMLDSDLDGFIFQKTVMRIRVDESLADARFIFHALSDAHRSGRIALDYSVSTIPHFTLEKANRLKVEIPSLSNQRETAKELDGLYSETEQMLSDTTELKSLLLERRSALITDVVTGRKQVV